MNHLSQIFTWHPVGQGLFYTGTIHLNRDEEMVPDFKMVFDCGSFNYSSCDEEVDWFKQHCLRSDTDRIDLLVISHFDADHVNKLDHLLDGGRKINKLVMPYITFKERLFLVLRMLAEDGDDAIGGNTIDLIIDPIGTLGNNLDGNSEVFLITDGPPPKPGSGERGIENNERYGDYEKQRIQFDFPDRAKDVVSESENESLRMNTGASNARRLSKVKHSELGVVSTLTGSEIKLMEFIFYRKDVGVDTQAFFQAVADEFCKELGISTDKPENDFLNEVISKIKTRGQRSATKHKDLLKRVKKDGNYDVEGNAVRNLNTTALSLLHLNCENEIEKQWHKDRSECGILEFVKPDGTKQSQIPPEYHFRAYWRFHYRYCWEDYPFAYNSPNTLLTSDGFLKTDAEVDAFYDHFARYWDRMIVFQVPHHGSRHSSDEYLFAKLPVWIVLTLNYGTRHQFHNAWKHPHNEVIQAITATGKANLLIAINEFQGLKVVAEYRSRN